MSRWKRQRKRKGQGERKEVVSPTLLLLAFLAQPECRIDREQASHLVTHIITAERKYQLPEGILAAVVLAESGGRNKVSKTKDFGPAQIHNKPGLTIKQNLMEGAKLLHKSRAKCMFRKCLCAWAYYNFYSKRWCHRVTSIHSRIVRYGYGRVAGQVAGL